MCGIVGAVSGRNIVPILVQGLQRLEYRGYDSCGVAVNAAQTQMGQAAGLQRARSTERVAELRLLRPAIYRALPSGTRASGISA